MRDTLRAIAFGYGFLVRHAGALAMLAAWRIAVALTLLLAIDYLAPAEAGDLLAEAQIAGKYLALALARTLLYAATLSAVALAWHRAAAGGGALPRWAVPVFTPGTRRYFLTVAGLALAAALWLSLILFGGNALGAWIAEFLEVWRGPPSKVLFLGGTALMLWALARLSPLLPQVALKDGPPRLRRAWDRSRGHAGFLLLLMLATVAPLPVAARILAHYAGEAAPALTLPLKAFAELAGILGILVFLAALTRYRAVRLAPAEASG